jgi:hypothetical protein
LRRRDRLSPPHAIAADRGKIELLARLAVGALTLNLKWRDAMIERLMTLKEMISHRVIYGGLSGCHLWAAVATGKWEVYVPMAVLYALALWRG